MILSITLLVLGTTGSRSPIPPIAEFLGSEPQIAASGANAFITFGLGDQLFVAGSNNSAKSFKSPVKLPTTGHLALGMRRGPRIAANGKIVLVLAVYGQEGGGKDGDVLAWRSVNAGKSWAGPSIVSDVPGSASEGLHAVAVSSKGRFASAWLDHRNGSAEIWSSVSDDKGKTWSKNVRVYRSPDVHVCECCHPSIAFGPGGEVYVMFRNWLGGARDMYMANSPSGGNRYGPAEKLGTGTWPLNACPMDGGSLAVRPDGTVCTIWRREGTVYLTSPGSEETEIGPGTQPWLAIMGNETSVVWQQQGQIVCRGPGGTKRVLGSGRDPVIANVGGKFLAAWTDYSGRVVLMNAG